MSDHTPHVEPSAGPLGLYRVEPALDGVSELGDHGDWGVIQLWRTSTHGRERVYLILPADISIMVFTPDSTYESTTPPNP